jgi:hypothetical protein
MSFLEQNKYPFLFEDQSSTMKMLTDAVWKEGSHERQKTN